MKGTAGGRMLHVTALMLSAVELVLLLAAVLLPPLPGTLLLLLALSPLTLVLLVADGLRLRGELSGRDWRGSAGLYLVNLAAVFLLVCFGGWLRTVFDFPELLEAIAERNLFLLGLGYLAQSVVLLEAWLITMCHVRRRMSHGVWFYVLGTGALYLLFCLGDFAWNQSVNWLICMVQSLVMAEGWLLIHGLKQLLQPEKQSVPRETKQEQT